MHEVLALLMYVLAIQNKLVTMVYAISVNYYYIVVYHCLYNAQMIFCWSPSCPNAVHGWGITYANMYPGAYLHISMDILKGSLVIRRKNSRRLTKETPKEAHQNTMSHILIPLYNLTNVDRQTWEDSLDPLSGMYRWPHPNKWTPCHAYSRSPQSVQPDTSGTILQPCP